MRLINRFFEVSHSEGFFSALYSTYSYLRGVQARSIKGVRPELATQSISGGASEIPYPPVELMFSIGSPDPASFTRVGEAWYKILENYLPSGDMNILDIGCGCGRMARFFTELTGSSSYVGFDCIDVNVRWSQNHLTTMNPKLKFVYADIFSREYNPKGKVLGHEYVFPVADQIVDVAIAASLFTHLMEDDFRQYLREAARALRPTGFLVASFHTRNKPNEIFSGDEARMDVDLRELTKILTASGLRIHKDVGVVLGQHILIVQRAQ